MYKIERFEISKMSRASLKMVTIYPKVCYKEPKSAKFSLNPELYRYNSNKTTNLFVEKEIYDDTTEINNIQNFFTILNKFLIQIWFD